MTRVLIVDDDERLLNMLRRTFVYEGFEVTVAADGEAALVAAEQVQPAVIVLDWLMPGLNGIDVVRRLRAGSNHTLILMLTARDAIADRVEGLDSGADDYLVKPFAPVELLARVHALLRRAEPAEADEILTYADLRLDAGSREAWRADRRFQLTATEFDLLRFFLRHPRQVLRREQILQEVWGYDFCGEDNVLEVYVGYLRKKTEAANEPRLIQTVRGVGYTLREA